MKRYSLQVADDQRHTNQLLQGVAVNTQAIQEAPEVRVTWADGSERSFTSVSTAMLVARNDGQISRVSLSVRDEWICLVRRPGAAHGGNESWLDDPWCYEQVADPGRLENLAVPAGS